MTFTAPARMDREFLCFSPLNRRQLRSLSVDEPGLNCYTIREGNRLTPRGALRRSTGPVPERSIYYASHHYHWP